MRFCTADLHGEELLRFRTGDKLMSYCERCVNGEKSPVTYQLGCSKGDDPQVQDFFHRADENPAIGDAEKCPLFLSEETGTEGATEPDTVIAGIAGMMKEVPGDTLPHTQEGWEELLDETLSDLAADNPEMGPVVQRAVDELVKLDDRAYHGSEQDYDYVGLSNLSESPALVNKEKTSAVVEEEGERKAFFEYLAELGLSSSQNESQALSTITRALTTWRDGLLSAHTDTELAKSILADFKAQNF